MDHTPACETSATGRRRGIAIVLNVGNSRIRKIRIPMETQIKQSLEGLMAAIKVADGQRIADEMGRLEGWLAAGQAQLHPQLVHFLQNRSYAKALMFLGGASDIPVGVCGGRAGRS